MARTRKSEIQRRYRELEEAAKERYKDAKGYQIAYNWSNTSEAKRIARNRRRALNRYDDRQLKEQLQKKVFRFDDPDEIKNFQVITDQDFYFNVLYSGPDQGDSLIINQFRLAETGAIKPVRAVIQDEDGSTRVYRTMYEFDQAVNRLYNELYDRQMKDWKAANKEFKENPDNEGKKLPKSGFIRLVSITSGETDKFEVITLRVENPGK